MPLEPLSGFTLSGSDPDFAEEMPDFDADVEALALEEYFSKPRVQAKNPRFGYGKCSLPKQGPNAAPKVDEIDEPEAWPARELPSKKVQVTSQKGQGQTFVKKEEQESSFLPQRRAFEGQKNGHRHAKQTPRYEGKSEALEEWHEGGKRASAKKDAAKHEGGASRKNWSEARHGEHRKPWSKGELEARRDGRKESKDFEAQAKPKEVKSGRLRENPEAKPLNKGQAKKKNVGPESKPKRKKNQGKKKQGKKKNAQAKGKPQTEG
ncbi:MAG: hypothetical protein IJS50_01895 [Desulfovibrio sp.]|nr:hypothetical protein [Desulfovibrio sp.]